MNATLVLNPAAGTGRGRRAHQTLVRALHDAGIHADWILVSSAEALVERVAAMELRRDRPLLVAGGDGTVHQVVNALMQRQPTGPIGPLGLVPLGTGNNLAFNLGIPDDLAGALEVVRIGTVRPIDLGQVEGRCFVNNAGLGIEALVAARQRRVWLLRGGLRYPVAALGVLARRPAWSVRLEWDTGAYEGLVSMVSLGNGPRAGGPFYTVPHADPCDGRLSFTFGHVRSRRALLRAMLMMFRHGPGNITEHPAVRAVHSTRLRIVAPQPLPLHADGEILPDTHSVTIRVLPARLGVFSRRP